MDAEGFDRLTAALVNGRSRRTLLAALATALGGFLGLSGLADPDDDLGVGANRRRKGKGNRKGKGKGKKKKYKNRKKKKEERCNIDADCPPPQRCNAASGECECPFQCCSDEDCRADEFCANINNSFNCFPEQ